MRFMPVSHQCPSSQFIIRLASPLPFMASSERPRARMAAPFR